MLGLFCSQHVLTTSSKFYVFRKFQYFDLPLSWTKWGDTKGGFASGVGYTVMELCAVGCSLSGGYSNIIIIIIIIIRIIIIYSNCVVTRWQWLFYM